MRRFLVLLFAVVAVRGAVAADRLVPVMNGTIGNRTYRTTIDLRSPTTEECRFEFRRPDGTALYAVEPVEAGKPKLLDEFASAQPVVATTIRVACTGAVDIHSRIHESEDGGVNFDEGPLFGAVIAEPLVAGQKHAMHMTGDFIVAEVHGAPARVIATLTATSSDRVAEKQYDLEPFEERFIGTADVLRFLGPIDATFEIEGEGRVIVITEVIDPAFANRARRAPADVRARLDAQVAAGDAPSGTKPSVIEQLLTSPFKAAPFRDPATGLVLMRDRWYDPQTGTFLSPDPMGYNDSSNLYSFCGGDPVNCSDPTGRAASVGRSGVIIGIRPDGTRYRIEPGTDPISALRILESDADLGFDDQEDILNRARLAIPYSSACRAGESCIGSAKPNNRAFAHTPKGGGWGYTQGVLMAGANMLTAPGAALTRDPAFVGFEPKTREQQFSANAANLTAAVIGTSAAFRGAGKGKVGPAKPAPTELGPQEAVVNTSRVNVSNEAAAHVTARHLSGNANASQFSISWAEVRTLLTSSKVVRSPVVRAILSEGEGWVYVREVNIGRVVGVDKMTGKPTTTMTVITTRDGTLISTFPGVME